MRYFHIIDNQWRNGIPGYVVIRTYKSRAAMIKFVEKQGKPVWVVASEQEALPASDGFGMANGVYWNSGAGWQFAAMPRLPLHGE